MWRPVQESGHGPQVMWNIGMFRVRGSSKSRASRAKAFNEIVKSYNCQKMITIVTIFWEEPLILPAREKS